MNFVATIHGDCILIAEDIGPAPTIASEAHLHNLTVIHRLNLSRDNPIYQKIVARQQGYGLGRVGTGILYPVSTTDILELIAQQRTTVDAVGRNRTTCPKCHTYYSETCSDCTEPQRSKA